MKIKQLGELESEVMEIIWKSGECSVRDVVDQIQREKHLAYTTIATVMTRLVEKDILKKINKDTSIKYVSRLTKESMGKTVLDSFINKFFASFGNAGIASFAESIEELPKSQREYLLKLLNEHK